MEFILILYKNISDNFSAYKDGTHFFLLKSVVYEKGQFIIKYELWKKNSTIDGKI